MAVLVRRLPGDVLNAADSRVQDLEKRKKSFAAELSKEQQEFVAELSVLASQADKLATSLDVERAEENHYRAQQLSEGLRAAKADGERINRREGLFGWPITSHEMLAEVGF